MTHAKESRQNFWRGAALYETALSLGVLLTMTLGTINLSTAGYQQLVLDAGSYSQAHQESLGIDPKKAFVVTQKQYGIDTNIVTADSTSYYPGAASDFLKSVDYGFAKSNARHGGVSFILPYQQVIKFTSAKSLFKLNNVSIQLSGIGTEPIIEEVCPHYCLDKGGYTTTAAYLDTRPYFPQTVGSTTEGEDTSPYFGGFQFMTTCGDDTKVDLLQLNQWDSCPTNTVSFRALGSAEQLDFHNNADGGAGMDQPSATLDPTQVGPFFAIWCHRRMYAWIQLHALSLYPSVPLTPTDQQAFLAAWLFKPSGGNPGGPGYYIYGSAADNEVGWDTDNLPTTIGTGPDVSPTEGCDKY